jgi:phage terminase large subunit
VSNEYNLNASGKQHDCLQILTSDQRAEVLWGGAAGAGKTFLGCIWQITTRLTNAGTHGLIIRQTRKDIYSTVLITFAKVAEAMGAGNGWSYSINQQRDEIEFDNGSVIFLRDGAYKPSDPNYDRLKVEVMDAWIEEGTQVDERAYIAIRPRIREVHGGSKSKLLITSNPGNGWVKTRFVKDENGQKPLLSDTQHYIQALVWDNLDKAFAANYAESLSQLDPITRAMYLDGNWDVSLNDNPFFYSFQRSKHLSKIDHISTTDYVDLSFDFNHTPTTLIVGQLTARGASVIDHISTTPTTVQGMTPIEAACEVFKRRYIDTGLVQLHQIRITGDASGAQRKADRKADENFYFDILKSFGLQRRTLRTPKANPMHKESYEMINYILSNLSTPTLTIGDHMTILISEIEQAYPDERLSLDKAKKELGLHGVDAFRYLMHLWFDARKYKQQVLYLQDL